MKSNEEFIAGIYKKAEELSMEQVSGKNTNVIQLDSFRRKVKKLSTYAAGLAACFVCGVAVYVGFSFDKGTTDQNAALEGRTLDDEKTKQPALVDSAPRVTNVDEESAVSFSSYLHCTVNSISEKDGISRIEVQLDNEEIATLLVPIENKHAWIEEGKEIVVSVYEPDSYGTYSLVPDSEVYIYHGDSSGEKEFISESNQVIRESDLNIQQ